MDGYGGVKVHLTFLFMSQSSAGPGSTPDDWEPDKPCGEYYHIAFKKEGYFRLLEELLKMKIIDRLNIFYESNKHPGRAHWVNHPNAFCAVVPEIRLVEKYITDRDIIWVRGGFKHWHDWLVSRYAATNWLMLYAANTGRQRWSWWDVILDDMDCRLNLDKFNRLTVPFTKPIDDQYYKPLKTGYEWDVCIGNSHIHDKKGQWRAFEAVDLCQKIYGDKLKVVIPGSSRRGVKTRELYEKIHRSGVQVEMTGHVPKGDVRDILNKSRMALFMGAHGQNDRGPLEALACGTPVIIGSPQYHTKMLCDFYDNEVYFLKGLEDLEYAAKTIRYFWEISTKTIDNELHAKIAVARKFKEKLGFNKSIREMGNLLLMMSAFHPTHEKSKENLVRLLGTKVDYDAACSGDL
jgi:glycosyltransferase involved in cell wall biosynthesis